MHALKACFPSHHHAMQARWKHNGLAAVDGRVELGAIRQVAGVVDRIHLHGLSQRTVSDADIDVLQGIQGFGTAGYGGYCLTERGQTGFARGGRRSMRVRTMREFGRLRMRGREGEKHSRNEKNLHKVMVSRDPRYTNKRQILNL